ncbi:hypothetical protein SAMN04489713_104157 [Actinomadura madurae]|uniref:SnoaL-like polyketide cyclase n=1 Tax=Actinomadura madurae TaxID=1993 RepID=A0A1I5EL69_9ACTN|nr:hypothetical protein SAMN04489713_104157 [Actinomadura madurae]SPT59973.1 Uncharacterised protein [Actinomadura madurae]
METVRVRNGQIVEHWAPLDTDSMSNQSGL